MAVKSLYKDVHYAVRINGHQSDYFPVTTGVKQGCVLSPAVFAIYVNDLVDCIKQCNSGVMIMDQIIYILLFADDIAILAPTEDELQNMINCVHEYC